jgi:hypothetical protein
MATDNKRSYSGGHFMLSLDGEPALLKDFDGGNIKAEVVTNQMGPHNLPQKSISTLKFEPYTINVGLSMGSSLYEWIKASLQRAHIYKNGYVVSGSFDYKAMSYRHFRDALITEVTFPAFDAANKDSSFVTVKFDVEETTYAKGDNADLSGVVNHKQKRWNQANFRCTLGGLPCKKVSKVDSFTIKQGVVEDPVGEFRINQKVPSKLEIPNQKWTISMADHEEWSKWFDDFVIKGNNGQDKELNGSIEWLDQSTKEVLGSIELRQCGIFSMSQAKLEANKDGIAQFTVEFYCEAVELKLNHV